MFSFISHLKFVFVQYRYFKLTSNYPPSIPKVKLSTVLALETKIWTIKACFFCRELEATGLGSGCQIHGVPSLPPLCQEDGFLAPGLSEETASPLCRHLHHWHNCPELHKAIDGVKFIADHTKREEDSTRVRMLVDTEICPAKYLTSVMKLRSPTHFPLAVTENLIISLLQIIIYIS